MWLILRKGISYKPMPKSSNLPLSFLTRHTTLVVAFLSLSYFLLGKLSFSLHAPDNLATPAIFYSEGVALAAAILIGPQAGIGVFFGQLVLALTSDLNPIPAVLISTSNALEAVIAAFAVKRLNIKIELSRIEDFVKLIFLILCILQPFSAILGNLIITFSASKEIFDLDHFINTTASWWSGNSIAQILVAPILLNLFSNKQALKFSAFDLLPSVILIGLSCTVFIFEWIPASLAFSILLPTLLWLAYQQHLAALGISLLLGVTIATAGTSLGLGPFAKSMPDSILGLNVLFFGPCLAAQLLCVMFLELSNKQKYLDIAKYNAYHDSLTGLANRSMIQFTARQQVALTNRNHCPCALLFIDLDNFKGINDTYGHDAGDAVLREIAFRLKSKVRTSDTVARLGGDEFVALLTNTNAEIAASIAQKILEVVCETPMNLDGALISISCTIGIAIYPDSATDEQDLFTKADKALYVAKGLGKNQIFEASNLCEK